jgi:hypothetical protein
MTRARRWTAGIASILASTVAFGGRVDAQEPKEPETEGPVLQPLTPDPNAETPRDEMIRLFHEVERALESIDVGLAEAGAGEAPLGEGQESGIDRLLRATSDKGKQAVDGIDRILQLAQEMSSKSGGT